MFKINLQEELVKENRRMVTDSELLLIKETDKFMSEDELNQNNLDTLRDCGLNNNIDKREQLNKLKSKEFSVYRKYGKDNIFTLRQIDRICMRYYLKFLPTYFYKGDVDENVPMKISNFKAIRDIVIKDKSERKGKCYSNKLDKTKFYIMAPSESFNLSPKPIDPLLFYKVDDGYFFLIHKWGNDLSMFRRLKSVFSGGTGALYSFIIQLITLFSLGYYFPFINTGANVVLVSGLVAMFMGSLIFSGIIVMITCPGVMRGAIFYSKNEPYSRYF